MDRLTHYIAGSLNQVKTNLSAGDPPPDDALCGYTKGIVKAMKQLLAGAPAEITDTVSAAWADQGWSWDTNSGSISAEGLVAALESLAATYPAPEEPPHPEPQVDTKPTEEELGDLSMACNRLWDLDQNRLTPGEDYEVDLQGGKKVYSRQDMAGSTLFKWVKEDVWKRPTYESFWKLLDNYERETGVAETVTKEEKAENWDFINHICDTPCMDYIHRYLVAKNLMPKGKKAFAAELYRLWFELYRRGVNNDSSGFEHVFIGEEKDGKLIGFHNWIQFYTQELKGDVDYKGYILPRKRGAPHPDGSEQLVSIQFAWYDEQDGSNDVKQVSSMLLGVSPEFEMAVYTLCFVAGEEHNKVEMGPYDVEVTCYKIRSRFGPKIGSSFPSAIED